jgi:hypothetical protein
MMMMWLMLEAAASVAPGGDTPGPRVIKPQAAIATTAHAVAHSSPTLLMVI